MSPILKVKKIGNKKRGIINSKIPFSLAFPLFIKVNKNFSFSSDYSRSLSVS